MRPTPKITQMLKGFIQQKLYELAIQNMCKECFTDLILEDVADRLLPEWVAEFESEYRRQKEYEN